VIEDYMDEGVDVGGFSKFMEKVALEGTKVEKLAMGVSEYREHYARLQHFMQIIYKEQAAAKKTYSSIDELMQQAADRVKRFHPDVTMLSTFELRYMRRLIPFYSWFRGVLPIVASTLVTQPGRVLAFPKISYNVAVMSGVDPNSLSDPFPTDQLFPSFLSEQMVGPVIDTGEGYFGISPGVLHVDVLNTIGTDPLRGVAGMVSPLIRMPAEMLSGGAWGTGARIKDMSDYLDSSLPGVNYAANISGFSPTGSVASLMQGQGLDPQYQQAAGNKTEQDQLLSLLNWFTGFGINNQSRPNFINYAEIEKRNKEGQASGF
jgi:hypothetical protein